MSALPRLAERSSYQSELDALRVREKAHTHEGDAVAAARRRLPMVEMDAGTPLIGAHGPVTLLDAFEGAGIRVIATRHEGDGNDQDGDRDPPNRPGRNPPRATRSCSAASAASQASRRIAISPTSLTSRNRSTIMKEVCPSVAWKADGFKPSARNTRMPPIPKTIF